MNNNVFNLSFTFTHSTTMVQFLDLEIIREGDKIYTKTFFKEIDSNSYIKSGSCHYLPWLQNIPKGQFKRIKRNCTKLEDFRDQANILKDRFLERDYNAQQIDKAIMEVEKEIENIDTTIKHNTNGEHDFALNSNTQNSTHKSKNNNFKNTPKDLMNEKETLFVPFITKYTSDSFKIRNIFKRNWHLLSHDPILV